MFTLVWKNVKTEEEVDKKAKEVHKALLGYDFDSFESRRVDLTKVPQTADIQAPKGKGKKKSGAKRTAKKVARKSPAKKG